MVIRPQLIKTDTLTDSPAISHDRAAKKYIRALIHQGFKVLGEGNKGLMLLKLTSLIK